MNKDNCEVLISVIMPVYNSERYLDESVKSIMNQSFESFELICIDDDSLDNSLLILDGYRHEYDNIVVLENLNNMGAAYCRNKGLEIASGKYVIFVDSDDYFCSHMLESAFANIKENEADVCLMDYVIRDNYKGEFASTIKESGRSLRTTPYFGAVFNYNSIDIEDIVLFPLAPWNKLIRRYFLQNNNIKFQSLSSANDVLFSLLVYLSAERICIADCSPTICMREHVSKYRISNNRIPMNEYLACLELMRESERRKFDFKQVELLVYEVTNIILSQVKLGHGNGMYYTFLQEEGIDNIQRVMGNMWDRVPEQYKMVFENIKNREYSSKWFESIDLGLLFFSKDIWSIWDDYRNISIWGAGQYGKELITAVIHNNKKVQYIFDSNFQKNLIVDGQVFETKEYGREVVGKSDLIIITIKNVPEEVVKSIRSLDEKVDLLHMKKIIQNIILKRYVEA